MPVETDVSPCGDPDDPSGYVLTFTDAESQVRRQLTADELADVVDEGYRVLSRAGFER